MRKRSTRQGRKYAAIPNAAMRDENLSIAARGLLALLMTYADDWVFRMGHLQKIACCGRDKMREMLKELEAAGYVVREVIRRDDNKLAGTQWAIIDDPEDPTSCASAGDAEPDLVDGAASRPPENPSIGKNAHNSAKSAPLCNSADSLKNRPPDFPTAGKPVTLRKPTDKEKKDKKPLTPTKVDLDAVAEQWVGAVKAGRSYAGSAINRRVAERMLERKLVTHDELRAVGIVL